MKSFVGIILAVGSFYLAFPGGPLPVLAWVALIPLIEATRGLSRWQAAGVWFGYGVAIWIVYAWWLMVVLVHKFMEESTLVVGWVMLYYILAATPYAVFGWIQGWRQDNGRALSPCWSAVGLTVLLGWWNRFIPTSLLAYCHYDRPGFIQVMEWGGVPLLLLITLMVNWSLAAGVTSWRSGDGSYKRWFVAAGLILAITWGYGVIHLRQLHQEDARAPAAEFITIGYVQPNIPCRLPEIGSASFVAAGDRDNDVNTLMADARDLMRRHLDLDLLVFPETPGSVGTRIFLEYYQPLAGIHGDPDFPILACDLESVEKVGTTATNGDTRSQYISLYSMTVAGDVRQRYRKRRLTPLSEYLPGETRWPWLRHYFPQAGRFTAGEETTVFHVNDRLRIVPSICYESIFSDSPRPGVLQDGNLVVSVANDAWFGWNRGARNHLAMTAINSAAYRMPLAHVTNSGISGAVKATGEFLPDSLTPMYRRTSGVYRLRLGTQSSFYARHGDVFLVVLTLVAVVGLAAPYILRARNLTPGGGAAG